MNMPFKEDWDTLRRRILGLGEGLVCKSHYPSLRKRLQELELFRSMVDLSGDLLFLVDGASHCIIDVNASAREHIGRPREQLIGQPIDSLLQPAAQMALQRALDIALPRAHSLTTLVSELPSSEGRTFPAEIKVRCGTSAGQLFAILAVRDIAERKEAEAQLRYLALHDVLTGLPNRLLLSNQLNHAIERSKRSGSKGAVLYIDLDRFKSVNDSLGHPAGDELLQIIARRLLECLRKVDTLARLGGDEFIVLQEDLSHSNAAAELAQKLIEQIANPVTLANGYELFISGSIGISFYPEDADNVDQLVQQADAALYDAKESGRNTYRVYRQALTHTANKRRALEAALRLAVANREFVLHYQPLVSLVDGRICALEALLRWQPPGGELIEPTQFIQLAEETGLIVEIGEWVLREACRQMQDWLAHGIELDSVAVNLSPLQFREQELHTCIERILAETGLPGKHLEVDITEGAIMRWEQQSGATLCALKSLGIRIAIDNFGTGYSSLTYLKHFPIDKLKIDMSFIRDFSPDSPDTKIVLAIIAMARNLQLEALAGGIETEEQRQFLAAQGCNSGQGYLFSRAITADQITALLGYSGTLPSETVFNA